MASRFPWYLTNTALPQVLASAAAVRQYASVLDHFQYDADTCDLTGSDVLTVHSLKSGSSRTLAQATTSKLATLTANQIGTALQFPAGLFVKASLDQYSGATYDASGNFSIVLIFKPATDAVQQGLVSIFTSSGNRFNLEITSTSGFMAGRCAAASIFAAFNLNAWNIAIITKTATSFRLRVNGVTLAPVAHTNVVSAVPLVVGVITTNNSPADVLISDIFVASEDILDNAPLMASLQDWTSTVLGLAA